MERQNLEPFFQDILAEYGTEILDNPSMFKACLSDVSTGKIKKINTVKLLITSSYLQFFKSISGSDHSVTQKAVENASIFASDHFGIDRKLAFEISEDLAHAIETYKGLPRTEVSIPNANPKAENNTQRNTSQGTNDTRTTISHDRSGINIAIIILSIVLFALLLVAAFLIWKSQSTRDTAESPIITVSETDVPSNSIPAEIASTQTEAPSPTLSPSPTPTPTSTPTATPTPTVTAKERFDFVPSRFRAANDVSLGMFVYQYELDRSDVLETDSYPYKYFRVPQANSTSELLAYCKRFYTESVANSLVNSHDYIVRDGKLYMDQTMGLGDAMISKVELSVSKTSDTSLAVTYIEYYEYVTDPSYPHTVNLILINGNWVWDEELRINTDYEIVYN